MGRYKYLANHIALFSISNFVSKILVFLLVPFYTSVLTTHEYGIADIMQVTLLLLVPALTMNMGEAALRFGIEKEEKRADILRVGLKYSGAAMLFVAVAAGVSAFFVPEGIRLYLLFFVFLFAANALYEFLILFFQGSEMVPVVVIGSIICTMIMIGSNLFLLLVLKIGLNGYLLAQIISYLAASIVMILLAGRKQFMNAQQKDIEVEREMLNYGKPMILYSTGSWINNASDRYIVAAICGTAVNGIYGAAYKIPAMLTVFQRIFAQAWQMSATKNYLEEDSSEFFSTMYKVYNAFMVLGCSFLIVIVKLLAQFLFKKDFFAAWEFVPPLLISIIFGALTGFLGSICLAHKDSKSMGIATGIGAFINIVLNLLSVPFMGAMGAAIATAISYYTMYLMAFLIVRKYVKLQIHLMKDYFAYVVVILQAIFIIKEIPYVYWVNSLLLLILVLIYYQEIRQILKKLLNKYAHKRAAENPDGEEEQT